MTLAVSVSTSSLTVNSPIAFKSLGILKALVEHIGQVQGKLIHRSRRTSQFPLVSSESPHRNSLEASRCFFEVLSLALASRSSKLLNSSLLHGLSSMLCASESHCQCLAHSFLFFTHLCGLGIFLQPPLMLLFSFFLLHPFLFMQTVKSLLRHTLPL